MLDSAIFDAVKDGEIRLAHSKKVLVSPFPFIYRLRPFSFWTKALLFMD
jgi:hypothetical protein